MTAQQPAEVEIRKFKCHIIRDALQSLGLIVTTDNPTANVIFYDGLATAEDLQSLKPEQKVNKIPNMDHFCYKSTFFDALCQMKTLFPSLYTFYPNTFQLPHCFSDFQKEHIRVAGRLGQATWIVKPEAGCCGVGIRIIQSPLEIANDNSPAIVQQYISPFLLDGHKFDMRFYLLISKVQPFTAYIYHEGIARFCTDPYVEPKSSADLSNKFANITNTAVNVENKGTTFDFTRLASSVLATIAAENPRGANLWEKIKSASMLSLLALYPQIMAAVSSLNGVSISSPHQIAKPSLNRYFHILGIDVLIDSDLQPKVLEMNDRPSMKVTFPLETPLKKSLLREAFQIVDFERKEVTIQNQGATQNGWERLLPMQEDEPLASTVRSIQTSGINVFGEKYMAMQKTRGIGRKSERLSHQ